MNKKNTWSVVLVLLAAFVGASAGTLYAPTISSHAEKALGAPKWIVTALPMGLSSIMGLIIMLPVGILADRTGRRKAIIIAAMAVTAVANIGLARSNSWVTLSIWRVFTGLALSFMPLCIVLVTFMFSEKRRGLAVALATGIAMLGMGGIQAMSGTIVEVLSKSETLRKYVQDGYVGPYYLAAGLAVLAILFILPAKIPVVKSPTGISGKDIIGVISHRTILYTGISLMIYLIGWQAIYGAFITVLQNDFEAKLKFATVFYAVISLMLGFGTFIWGPVIDKFGAKKTLFYALLGSAAATFAILPLLSSMWAYVLLFWLASLGGVVGGPGASVIATKSVKPELTTIGLNMMFMFVVISGIIGGFLGGFLILNIGLFGMILVTAAFELIGALMLLGLRNI